mmetsp:Transcript_30618/g.58035  ORF Transcript_30618/g.58035 Transcript_30618/m.58035 type:complete len:218 (-) Transcript_30618:469-1122(-)
MERQPVLLKLGLLHPLRLSLGRCLHLDRSKRYSQGRRRWPLLVIEASTAGQRLHQAMVSPSLDQRSTHERFHRNIHQPLVQGDLVEANVLLHPCPLGNTHRGIIPNLDRVRRRLPLSIERNVSRPPEQPTPSQPRHSRSPREHRRTERPQAQFGNDLRRRTEPDRAGRQRGIAHESHGRRAGEHFRHALLRKLAGIRAGVRNVPSLPGTVQHERRRE